MMEHAPGTATADEVLQYLTGVMRGDDGGTTAAMKAAELLGKRMGLFSEPQEDLPTPILLDDLKGEEEP